MSLSHFSHQIGAIVDGPEQNCERAALLLDRFAMLSSEDAKEAYVAALAHRLLVERARRLGATAP